MSVLEEATEVKVSTARARFRFLKGLKRYASARGMYIGSISGRGPAPSGV